jgi:maleylacetate reductase
MPDVAEGLTPAGAEDFIWRDGERTIRFAAGAAGDASRLLEDGGFERFVLLTTERAAADVHGLDRGAAEVVYVPSGKVDEISAELLGRLPAGAPLAGIGGGRVVDTTKALAGATGVRCAVIPTTLSGAEMTPFHRLPAGVDGARMVRPALVIADPDLMASAPPTRLAATAMNALAHAMEALYTPFRSPVTDLAALRAVGLLGRGITLDPPDRIALALGALLAGYASGSAGIAFHHALCQTIVRTAGAPHAEFIHGLCQKMVRSAGAPHSLTKAVVLPHSARLMAGRAPGPMGEMTRALGDETGEPEAAAGHIARIAARCGHTRLATLGVTEEHLPPIASAALAHPALALTPEPPGEAELLELLRAAL